MSTHRPVLRRLVACTVAGGALVAGCSSSATTDHNALEVMTWWTSTSEKPAFQVLLDAYSASKPSVAVKDVSVAGGSGSNAAVVLARRLTDDDAPDVWQTFTGPSTTGYVAAGRLADVSSALSDAKAALPSSVLDAVTVGGAQYGVPVSAHRQNVLLYNPAVLAKAGVSAPGAEYTQARLERDLDTVKRSGTIALCLGGKDTFAEAELFENVLLSGIGSDGWARLEDDRFDWKGPQVKTALAAYGRMLDHADPASGAMTWDAAAAKLAAGGCAFMAMNDSAYAEISSKRTVQAVPYPGTASSYLAVLDTFVVAKGSSHGDAAKQFLADAVSRPTQLAFAAKKGSVPVRTDVDPASLSAYQQDATKAYRNGPVLPSITHGELLAPTFQAAYYDAVRAYSTGRDAAAFATTLTTAAEGLAPAK